jgi:hypothetical protein
MKTSELTGAALDWAVAKCEGRTIKPDPMGNGDGSYWIWEETPSPKGGIIPSKSVYWRIGYGYAPSTNWSQGGPIIEREGICLRKEPDGSGWYAVTDGKNFLDGRCCAAGASDGGGDTPLIAAMRCYVASKLGDEVEIPKELLK